MPNKALTGRGRVAVQAGLAVLALGVIVIPVLAVSLAGNASADSLWTALRLIALEAFTFIFCNIVIGAFRPLLTRVFKGRALQTWHTATGGVGFGLAVTHGIMVLVFGTSGYGVAPLWVGPAVLAMLAVVVTTAMARHRLRNSWRWIHRLNYLIFAAILVHGMVLGSDLGTQPLLRACFWVYAAVVVAGFAYRLSLMLKTSRRPAQG